MTEIKAEQLDGARGGADASQPLAPLPPGDVVFGSLKGSDDVKRPVLCAPVPLRPGQQKQRYLCEDF